MRQLAVVKVKSHTLGGLLFERSPHLIGRSKLVVVWREFVCCKLLLELFLSHEFLQRRFRGKAPGEGPGTRVQGTLVAVDCRFCGFGFG